MGSHIECKCKKCGYETACSGGKDCGFLAVVQTMICEDCKELADVLIGCRGEEGPTGDPEYDKRMNICPTCNGKNIKIWSDQRPCPKCGAGMDEGEFVLHWD